MTLTKFLAALLAFTPGAVLFAGFALLPRRWIALAWAFLLLGIGLTVYLLANPSDGIDIGSAIGKLLLYQLPPAALSGLLARWISRRIKRHR
jgi:hypothetical protein